MPAHRPFFVIRNPATGQLRKVAYASVEDGMQQVVLGDGSTAAALDFPEPECSPKAGSKAKRRGTKRKAGGKSS